MVDDKWPFVPCQGVAFETQEYRHELLRNFGKFASKLPNATTAERNMSDFYEGAPGTTPLYLYGFLWGPLLEYIFSSQSFLQYCQDEPPLKPRFVTQTGKTDWSNCEHALSWLQPLDSACVCVAPREPQRPRGRLEHA